MSQEVIRDYHLNVVYLTNRGAAETDHKESPPRTFVNLMTKLWSAKKN